jgi:hypothetical protein
MRMGERLTALRESDDSMEFWGNDSPKCPHCAVDYRVEDNDAWRIYEEGEHELTCVNCGLDFTVSTRVSYSFDTERQPDEDETP